MNKPVCCYVRKTGKDQHGKKNRIIKIRTVIRKKAQRNTVWLSYEAGYSEKELSRVIGNHDGPVRGMAGGEKNPEKKQRVAQEEKSPANHNQLTLEGMPGNTADRTGAHQAQDDPVDSKKRKLFSDPFPAAEEVKIDHNGQKTDRADQMDGCRRNKRCEESDIAYMAGQKKTGTKPKVKLQNEVTCRMKQERGETDPAARIKTQGGSQRKHRRAKRTAELIGSCQLIMTGMMLIMLKERKADQHAKGTDTCNPKHYDSSLTNRICCITGIRY